jgi:hypothetical protein
MPTGYANSKRAPAKKSHSPPKKKPTNHGAGRGFTNMMNRLTSKPRKMALNTVKITGGTVQGVRNNRGYREAVIWVSKRALAALTPQQKIAIKKNATKITNTVNKMLK